ncbi:DedA family protein [Mycetocola spongiae]|uniref:DedA family protein n=1 Tax=Mycetocola spongiae TaxID=2859226 RepID=UPI001CF5C9B9|nr:DedA family protein [Mycetocola spongiae]UCR89414.1 DedA family protein [Mycetocola spongiae]
MNDFLNGFLDLLQGVDPVLRTLIAGFGMLLETSILVGLIVPGDTMVIVAATAVQGPVEFIGLTVAIILGALAGESIGFYLGRTFGGRIRDSRLGRWIGEKNWSRAERYLDRRGGIAVFLSRFLPVLHSVIPLTVGMSTMTYRRFIAWTLPACLIWSVAYVGAGSAAAKTYRELSGQLHSAGYIFVGILVLFIAAVFLIKKLIHRGEAQHLDDGDTPAAP